MQNIDHVQIKKRYSEKSISMRSALIFNEKTCGAAFSAIRANNSPADTTFFHHSKINEKNKTFTTNATLIKHDVHQLLFNCTHHSYSPECTIRHGGIKPFFGQVKKQLSKLMDSRFLYL